ncbi:MAG: GNAT superfamily N-acetyltransferase [Candidatus Latescibacterota bacterium]|jgi:GNAT superfamily N-acetyltransferase
MPITYRQTRSITRKQILSLYQANEWSSANKPTQLRNGLLNSHTLITAWDKNQLVGLGNALSDGHLVAYFPHLLVHPHYQRQGIGKKILQRLLTKYQGFRFHQRILVADAQAIPFYKKCGFKRANKTQPLWIYSGTDHE